MLLATVPSNRYGCWGTQAIWRRQAARSNAEISVPGTPGGPALIRPPVGAANRSSSASSELLPAPLGPVTATRSPGRIVRDTRSSAARSRPGYISDAPLRTIRSRRRSACAGGPDPGPGPAGTAGPAAAGRGVSRISQARPAAVTPSMLAWNCRPTARSGRYASGVSSRTSSAVWYGMCPASSRSPTSTATSAVATAADSSSTRADRNATRSVRMVACRCASVTSRITVAWALARPNSLSVGSPSTTSRKCPPRRASSRHWRWVWARVCSPISTAKTGISGSVTAITTAEIQSASPTRISTATGTRKASTSWGRNRAKYGSSASRPLVDKVASSPVRWPPSHAGPSRTTCAVSLRRSCDLTAAAARSAASSPP